MVVKRELANLTFSAQSPSVVSPNTALHFQVAMETTIRKNLTLQVFFGGDGGSKVYKLDNSSVQDEDGFKLVRSYANGDCWLVVELQHTYTTQGEFQPRLTISTTNLTKSIQLSHAIQIINRLSQPVLVASRAVAVNSVVNMTALLTTTPTNVTYFWSIEDDGQLEEHNITTKVPALSHKFSKPGIFTVYMRASNPINSVDVSQQIKVQVPLSDLSITSEPYQLLKTGDEISFSADLGDGTMVEYEWDFGDQDGNTYMGQQNLSAFANHTFTRAGKYNVSVRAYNDVSQLRAYLGRYIVVQDPVEDLDVSFTSPILINTSVTIVVTVKEGSDVVVYADFGTGSEYCGKVSDGSINIVKLFTQVLEYQVTVIASNNISEVTQTLAIVVQRGIGEINVSLLSIAVINQPIIFAVYHDSKYYDFSFFIANDDW